MTERAGRWWLQPPGPELPPGLGPRELLRLVDTVEPREDGVPAFWIEHATPRHDALVAEIGWHPDRRVVQMRGTTELDEQPVVPVRPFDPESDIPGLLRVNNEAFSWHPDQGGWSRHELARRMAEPWFDPEDLLVYEESGEIVGFCWIKPREDIHPPSGEIYVIGVRPDRQGRGLGRSLVLRGIEHIRRHGLGGVVLYVEHDNYPARRLYESLGLRVHHEDHRYVKTRPTGRGDQERRPTSESGGSPHDAPRHIGDHSGYRGDEHLSERRIQHRPPGETRQ